MWRHASTLCLGYGRAKARHQLESPTQTRPPALLGLKSNYKVVFTVNQASALSNSQM